LGAAAVAVRRSTRHLSAATTAATIRTLAAVAAAATGPLAPASSVASPTFTASDRVPDASVVPSAQAHASTVAATAATTAAAAAAASAFRHRRCADGAADVAEIRAADLRERATETQKNDGRLERVLDSIAGSGLPEEPGLAGRHSDEQEPDVRLREEQHDLRRADKSTVAAEPANRQVGSELRLRSDRPADGEEDSGHVRSQREAAH